MNIIVKKMSFGAKFYDISKEVKVCFSCVNEHETKYKPRENRDALLWKLTI